MTTTDLAITPGGRVGDASPLGTKGPRKLTDYEREIAHALMRKRGMSKSHAIAVAKNATKRWAAGGGKVRPQVRAGAAASLAESAALRARNHALSNEHPDDIELDWAAFDAARGHQIKKSPGSGQWVDAPKRSRSERRAAKKAGRHRAKMVKAAQQRQARIAKITEAQREQARRLVGTGTGWRDPKRPGGLTSAPRSKRHDPFVAYGLSESQREVLDLAFAEAERRDIELGVWSEALHPRDWRGRFGKKNALKGPLDADGRVIPSERESKIYAAHVKRADSLIIKHSPTMSTDVTHGRYVPVRDPHGHVVKDEKGKPKTSLVWDADRAKLQAKIVDQVYRRESKKAKSEGKALFLGGLPGAGKSTSISKIPGLNQSDYITINPDIFKEELARRGLVPKVEGLSPMEASAFVHEESSHMALLLAAKATKAKKNIIWDITMNKASSVESRLAPLKEAGYRTHAVFVDIPHAMSQQRVEQRHRSGHLAFMRDLTGQHLGQRLVPSTHVAGGKSKTGSSSANRDAFDAVKHLFDAHKLYDNSGKDPRLLEERGKFKV